MFNNTIIIKAGVNEYDFSRIINISLNRGMSSSMDWYTIVDRDGIYNEGGKWFNSLAVGEICRDREEVEHTIQGFDDNEWPDEGSFYQHTDCVGVTPYVYIMEPTREGYRFEGWDTNAAYFYEQGGYYFESGCYAAGGGDIYINALWERSAYSLNITKDSHVTRVEGAGEYSAGTLARITPYFSTGYILDYTEDLRNGQRYGAGDDPYSWNMFADRYIKVVSKPISYTIRFDANGGTGIMQDIVAVYDTNIKLPINIFTKSTDAGKSKFLGWNVISAASDILFADKQGVKNLVAGGEITLYAIWDDSPMITAIDRYYTLEDAQSGKITEESLLTTVKAADSRDSFIEDAIRVKDYFDEEWRQFSTDGSSRVVYEVTDSGGNTSFAEAIVHIVDTATHVTEDSSYVRFINEEYYQKTSEEGGLERDSIWRTNNEYAAVLKLAMDNRSSLAYETGNIKIFGKNYTVTKPGSIGRQHTEQTWIFSPDDIRKVKEFIITHGFGKQSEENALTKFWTEFKNCKINSKMK